jgi:PII-like signaling protein
MIALNINRFMKQLCKRLAVCIWRVQQLFGPMGFGHSSRLHTAKVLRLSFDLPIVVEIVDTEAKINEFLPVLDGMMTSGLITLEKVQVLQYGKEGLKERAGLA